MAFAPKFVARQISTSGVWILRSHDLILGEKYAKMFKNIANIRGREEGEKEREREKKLSDVRIQDVSIGFP